MKMDNAKPTIQTALVEDEPYARAVLKRLNTELNLGLEWVAELDSVQGAVHWFEHHPKPDLLILDIQLSDGLGFEILESMRPTVPVLFTTAYDQFVLRAFKEYSVDYLLKPVDPQGLQQAIHKFRTAFQHNAPPTRDFSALFDAVMNQMGAQTTRRRILGKLGNKVLHMNTDQIAYAYIEDEVVFLRSRTGEKMSVDYRLDQLEDLLDARQFFRINRGFMLHADSIQKMERYGSGQWLLHLNPPTPDRILVSRGRVKEFEVWFDR
ncbi:response regulator [bacterium]|nr:response regulator [bacterium]